MATKRKFKSNVFEAIHATARGLYKAGVIDMTNMRQFRASCLVGRAKTRPKPKRIRRVRVR